MDTVLSGIIGDVYIEWEIGDQSNCFNCPRKYLVTNLHHGRERPYHACSESCYNALKATCSCNKPFFRSDKGTVGGVYCSEPCSVYSCYRCEKSCPKIGTLPLFVEQRACCEDHLPLIDYAIKIGSATVNLNVQHGASLEQITEQLFQIPIQQVVPLDQKLTDSFFQLREGQSLRDPNTTTIGQFVDGVLQFLAQDTKMTTFLEATGGFQMTEESTLGNYKNNGPIMLFLDMATNQLVETQQPRQLTLERRQQLSVVPATTNVFTPETIDEDLDLDWLDARLILGTTTVVAVFPYDQNYSLATFLYEMFERDLEENPSRRVSVPLSAGDFPLMESDRGTGCTYIFLTFKTVEEATAFVASYMEVAEHLPEKTPKLYRAQVWFSFFRTALWRLNPASDPHFDRYKVEFEGTFAKGQRAYIYSSDMLKPENIFPPKKQTDVDIEGQQRRRKSTNTNKSRSGGSRKRSRAPTGRPRGRPPKNPKSKSESNSIKEVEIPMVQFVAADKEEEEDDDYASPPAGVPGDFLEHVMNGDFQSHATRQREEENYQQQSLLSGDDWASSDFDSDKDDDEPFEPALLAPEDEMDLGDD